MKFKIFFFIFLLTFSLHAQKMGLSIESGYMQGIQTKNFNDAGFPASNGYTLGSGINRQLLFHVYPDSSNWFVSLGFQHFIGNGTISASNGSYENKNMQVQHLQFNALRFVSRLNYSFRIKRYELIVSAGVLLPLVNRMREETALQDSMGYRTSQASTKYYTSIGFTGGLGISVPLTSKIKLLCKGDIQMLNAKVKSRKMTSYSDYEGQTFDAVYPTVGTKEVAYRRDVTLIRNNADFLPGLYNKDLPTDKLSYQQSFSSIGIQLGFLFLF